MKILTAWLLVMAVVLPDVVFAQREVVRGKDADSLRKAAHEIDGLIADFYRKQKLSVPSVTDDATFMRRAFLVGIGRMPTAEEALAFIEMEGDAKRSELVEYLMKSKGYSSHMTNWAFDLLRLRDRKEGGAWNNEPYRNWIRKAMDENLRWDEFVTRLVSSSGNGWDAETAAVGYYTIDRGMPLDNLANSMRIFLGSRMECAQCHDDPFGETERKDFYHLAAFTNGQYESKKHLMRDLWDELQEGRSKGDGFEYEVGQLFWDGIYGMSLSGGGKGRIELPSDYQYRDGKPGEVVGAKTPFGKGVRMSDRKEHDDGRKELAEWIVGKTEGQFPAVIANRMWERVMGKGIYEPLDEYVEASKTVYPGLMNHLAKLMHELEYDVRAFQHVLMLTKTFQFATNPSPSSLDEGDDFHGRKIERLSAEQIWDSLITLAEGDPDKKPARSFDNRIYVGGRPVLVGEMDMVTLSNEVMALSSEAEVRKYFREFCEKVKNGGGGGKGGDGEMSMEMASVRKYGRDSAVRASELPSPAPRDHFLYLFGASDREVVEGASKEPNVGQVLAMMNGYVQRKLVNDEGAHVYKTLEGADTKEEKIRRLYLAILNRPPTEEEMGWMKEEIEAQGDAGYRNIVAALVMSSEFLFLQ